MNAYLVRWVRTWLNPMPLSDAQIGHLRLMRVFPNAYRMTVIEGRVEAARRRLRVAGGL